MNKSFARTEKPAADTLLPLQGTLQRKCACGNCSTASGECAECAKKKDTLQRKAGHQTSATEVPTIVREVLAAPGRPLDVPTRAFMEPLFGHDFSRIRVHTDARAAESAREVSALAYTVGQDVVFGAGQYSPETERGSWLLAHELTHTVQQRSSGVSTAEADSTQPLQVGPVESSHEMEADTFAQRVILGGHKPNRLEGLAGDNVSVTGLMLARTDCSKLKYGQCPTGVYSCGYGGSGTCGWVGPSRGGCICLGANKPPVAKVLAVLAILGLSVALLATVIAALLDPEPATKLGLAGLTVAEAALLLTMLGYKEPDSSGPTASRGSSEGASVA
jgi:hypothetical protein